jgi:hypothetical protein
MTEYADPLLGQGCDGACAGHGKIVFGIDNRIGGGAMNTRKKEYGG